MTVTPAQPLPAAPTLDACTDAELATLTSQGQHQAFEHIMRRHNRLLFRTARSILRSDDDAQDVLQEAYLKAWRGIAAFREDARLSTWLVRIVVNEALGRLRRRDAQVLPLDASIGFQAEAEPPAREIEDNADDRPDRMTMRTQLRALMEQRIDALPEAFRTVFMLRAIEELSVEEVAQMLQLPDATVRTRLFRARSLLREGLAQDLDMATADAFAFAGARCDQVVLVVMAHLRA